MPLHRLKVAAPPLKEPPRLGLYQMPPCFFCTLLLFKADTLLHNMSCLLKCDIYFFSYFIIDLTNAAKSDTI